MRVLIYSLRSDKNGKSFLSIDLTNCLTDFENHQTNQLELKLKSGDYILSKWEYLNKMKIFDTGKEFMIFANKQLDRNAAFNLLLRYAVQKVNTRIAHLNQLKLTYQKELKVA
jgi:hypothetical protein